MKRITTLLLAVAFTLGSVCAAQADGIDIKVKGQWDFAFGAVNNRVFKKSANWSDGRGNRGAKDERRRDDDNFEARQRIRTQVNFISSEYLQAVLMFEIGDLDWGRSGTNVGRSTGAGLDADGVNIETKRAYLDWIIPNTEVSVRMGIQGITLPSSRLGTLILNADVAGIVVSAPVTDWLGLTVLWARPFDQYRNDYNQQRINSRSLSSLDDEADVFGIVAPMTFDGLAVSPYFVWADVGTYSGTARYMMGSSLGTIDGYAQNSSAKLWYLGTNIKLSMFDPLVLDMDVAYGHLQRAEYTLGKNATTGIIPSRPDGSNHVEIGSEGWYIAAALDYKCDWGTPGIFGWYSSGDDYDDFVDDGMLGRMPGFMTDGGNFKATTFGLRGYYGIGNGGNNALISGSGIGMWGLGIQVADVSFLQDLSHTLRFAYYRGTNDKEMAEHNLAPAFGATDAMYLTTDDSVFEVNFDHKYKIYENLTAVLELGYLHLRSDKDTWGANNTNLKDNDDAWKAEINFRYEF